MFSYNSWQISWQFWSKPATIIIPCSNLVVNRATKENVWLVRQLNSKNENPLTRDSRLIENFFINVVFTQGMIQLKLSYFTVLDIYFSLQIRTMPSNLQQQAKNSRICSYLIYDGTSKNIAISTLRKKEPCFCLSSP